MKPRVAMVLNTIGLGGVPEVAYQLLRHLPPNVVEPFVYVLKSPEDEAGARRARSRRFVEAGAEVCLGTATDKIGSVAAMAKWLEDMRIDVVHTHSFRPNLYGRLAAALRHPAGLKSIAHYHNFYDDKWSRNPSTLVLEQQLAATCDGFIAVSEAVRDHVAGQIGIPAGTLKVIHNGVDSVALTRSGDRMCARAALSIRSDDFVIGMVGRVCAQKGQEDLIAAAKLLSERHPEIVYLMVGQHEDKDLVRRLRIGIANSGLENRFIFTGHLDDMAAAYAAMDIVVAPSRWEGFGLMLVEAMAAGRPIVATWVGAIPEVVGDSRAALLIPPNNPEAFADAISRLVLKPSVRIEMGIRGQQRARDFNWHKSSSQLADAYAQVLEGARP